MKHKNILLKISVYLLIPLFQRILWAISNLSGGMMRKLDALAFRLAGLITADE